MAVAALPVDALLNIIDTAAPRGIQADISGDFLSLLTLKQGRQEIDAEADKRSDSESPQAVAIDVPVPIATPEKPARAADESLSDTVSSVEEDSYQPRREAADTPEAPAPVAGSRAENKAESPATETSASPVQSAAQETPADPAAQTQLQAGLQAQLARLGRIVETIIEALSAGAAITDQPGAPVADEIALLKDIQIILNQIQSLLQPESGAGEVGGASLPELTARLQQNIASLSQLLDVSGSSLPVLPLQALQEAAQIVTLRALLKESVTQLRAGFQQLKADNENAYSQTAGAVPEKLGDIALAFRDVLAGSGLRLKEAPPKSDAPAAVTTALTPAQVAASAAASDATPSSEEILTALSREPIKASTPVSLASFEAPALLAVQANVPLPAADAANGRAGSASQPAVPPLPAPAAPAAAAQQSSPAHPAGVSFSRALGEAGKTPVPEQVVVHVKTAIADGSSRIRIQLDPADLGKLDIRIQVGNDGRVGLIITADNRGTLDLLQRDAQGLARALADAGLMADSGSMDFNLRGDQREPGSDSAQAALTYQKIQPDEEEDEALAALTRSYVVHLSEGLDIKI